MAEGTVGMIEDSIFFSHVFPGIVFARDGLYDIDLFHLFVEIWTKGCQIQHVPRNSVINDKFMFVWKRKNIQLSLDINLYYFMIKTV